METTGNEKTIKFNDVDPLQLSSDTINVQKEWENALNDGREPAPVKLGVRAAGMDNKETEDVDESIFAQIDVSASTSWEGNPTGSWGGSANISTGLMEVENEKQIIYEHGHDFTLTEDVDPNARYHWELVADTYRPMVITDPQKGYQKPTTVMLKKVSASESYDYVIDGGYYARQTGTAVLTATNYRRSNLNLVKNVIDSAGKTVTSSQLFEFTITIDDPLINGSADSQDIWFSVQTDPDDPSTVVKDLYVEGATAEENGDGSHTGFFHAPDHTAFKVRIRPGWNLRVINLPSKTSYTITETAVTGYTFVSAAVDKGGTFEVKDGTTTGTGLIDESNKQYTVTYKNRTVTHNVSVWKTDMDHSAITTGAAFALYAAEDYDDAAQKPKTGAAIIKTGTTGSNGILTLGALAVGEYRLVETQSPKGFSPSQTAIRISVGQEAVTATQEGSSAEVARDVDGNEYRQYYVSGQAEGTWQIRVWNRPGTELPHTGGPGTNLICMCGILLTVLAGAGLWMRKDKELQ